MSGSDESPLPGRPLRLVVTVRTAMPPDVALVDALARLALAARRLGGDAQAVPLCAETHDLLELTGLYDVLTADPARRDVPG